MHSEVGLQLVQNQVIICKASILQPREIEAQSKEMRQDAGAMRGHAFGLRLSNDVVTRLEVPGHANGIRLTLYPSPRSVMVLCVTMQVRDMQVRTIADCSDPAVRQLLSSFILDGRVNWSIEVEAAEQVVWVSHQLTIPNAEDLLSVVMQSSKLSYIEHIQELSIVAAELMHPHALGTLLPGHDVETVVVALVSPALMVEGTRLH